MRWSCEALVATLALIIVALFAKHPRAGGRVPVPTPTLTETQVENLAFLGKVWGFAKYHHPAVTGGGVDWDQALIEAIPGVRYAPDRAAAARMLADWVGSTTAGADGNVSQIPLPGGVTAMITGIGVFYPDGTSTQRIGIVPDLEVLPTPEGIRGARRGARGGRQPGAGAGVPADGSGKR